MKLVYLEPLSEYGKWREKTKVTYKFEHFINGNFMRNSGDKNVSFKGALLVSNPFLTLTLSLILRERTIKK